MLTKLLKLVSAYVLGYGVGFISFLFAMAMIGALLGCAMAYS